jgi:hypothetical protein
MIKIDTWEIERYVTRYSGYGAKFIIGYRRKWEAYVRAMVAGNQTATESGMEGSRPGILQGIDETDILTVVDMVFKKLEGQRIRAQYGEASLKKYIRRVTVRTCIDLLRRWNSEKHKYEDPRKFQLIVDTDRGLPTSPMGAQLREGGVTTSGPDTGHDGEAEFGCGGSGGVGVIGIPVVNVADVWGGDPQGIFEARDIGREYGNIYHGEPFSLADLAKKYGIKNKNLALLKEWLRTRSYQQVGAKFALSEKQVRERINYVKRLIWEAVQKNKRMGKLTKP